MKNRVIVITGGSRGLGKELARLLSSKGNTVVICARDKNELEKSASEVGATAFVADVTKKEDMKALADFAVSSFGRIDIWINNAGIWMPHSKFVDMSMEKVRTLFEVNTFGALYGSQSALAQMEKQEEGTLVNIISVSGLSARPLSSGYAASKWAVRGFTDSICEEYKDTSINVVGVYPGCMKTNLFDEAKPGDFDEYMTVESVAEKIVENLEKETPASEQVLRR